VSPPGFGDWRWITKTLDTTPYSEFREYMARIQSWSGSIRYDDIDLMRIYAIAPWVYVLRVARDEGFPTFTFRFVGTGICDGLGFEPTGKNLESLDFGPGQDFWREAYRIIVSTRRPHVLSMTHYPNVEKMRPHKRGQAIRILRLIYPTHGHDGEIENLIGVAQFVSMLDPEVDQFYQFAPKSRVFAQTAGNRPLGSDWPIDDLQGLLSWRTNLLSTQVVRHEATHVSSNGDVQLASVC